jgi:hypothetical protein
MVVVLPLPRGWALQLPRRETIILVFLFGAGFMVTIAGATRTYFTHRLTETYDQTWSTIPVFACSSMELYVGAASSPFYPSATSLTGLDMCLRSLFKEVL